MDRSTMKTARTDAQKAVRSLRPDPVIEAYKKDIDRTLLRENLKLTVDGRFSKLQDFARFTEEVKRARRSSRG